MRPSRSTADVAREAARRDLEAVGRRRFLRSAGGAALALPLLATMGGRARAVPPAPPKRLIIFYSPNGTVTNAWKPVVKTAATEYPSDAFSFAPGSILSPLTPHQSDLIVLENIDIAAARYAGAHLSVRQLLTGRDSGISVDQYIASRVGGETSFPSLELGVHTDRSGVYPSICYSASSVVAPEIFPGRVYDRVFGAFGGDATAMERLRIERRSVLDAVSGELAAVGAQLGAEDRMKLELHAQSIRKVEKEIATLAKVGGACKKPGHPPPAGGMPNDSFPTIGKVQMDLLVSALACDLTRVASIQWSNAVSTIAFNWLGINNDHHSLSHLGDSDLAGREKLVAINRWHAEQLAYLISALKAIPEGSKTLFDSTVILWCNELSVGNTHSHLRMPYLLAGSAGGYFRTGRYLVYPSGTSTNDLLVSLCNAMGIADKSFGSEMFCTGALRGLT